MAIVVSGALQSPCFSNARTWSAPCRNNSDRMLLTEFESHEDGRRTKALADDPQLRRVGLQPALSHRGWRGRQGAPPITPSGCVGRFADAYPRDALPARELPRPGACQP